MVNLDDEVFDLALISILGVLFISKAWMIRQIVLPIWDGAVYMTNARSILFGQPLYEWWRPQLFPAMISAIWLFIGENYVPIKYIQLTFTTLTGAFFYVILKKDLGPPFALAGTVLLMTMNQVLFWSDHVLTHGVSLFFVVLTILLWRDYTPKRWLMGGVTGFLAILARWEAALSIGAVFIAYLTDHKRLLLFYASLVGLSLPLILLYFYSPTMLFGSTGLTIQVVEHYISPSAPPSVLFYTSNLWEAFGLAAFLMLPVLIMKSTYKEGSSRVWSLWFLFSFIGYSFLALIMSAKNLRFTFEWTPAVAYLATLTMAKASKLRLPKTNPVNLRIGLGIALAFLIGVNSAFSVNTYLARFNNHRQSVISDTSILRVADYVKQHTSPDEVAVSDFQAPILTYYSKRTFYEIKAETTEDLQEFLEKGWDHNWIKPRFVVFFPKLGQFSKEALSQTPFLKLQTIVKLSELLGEAYIYKYADKTVIFRSDDAQVWASDAFYNITDTIKNAGFHQTIAIIPHNISADVRLITYLNSLKGPQVEFALHGWSHSPNDEFLGLSLSEAVSKMERGIHMLNGCLGITPATFVPPGNSFDNVTLEACLQTGFSRFSAGWYDDGDSWSENPSGLLHVPETVGFVKNWTTYEFFSTEQIKQEIEDSWGAYGVSVIMLHYFTFYGEDGDIEQEKYESFIEVLDWLKSKTPKPRTICAYGAESINSDQDELFDYIERQIGTNATNADTDGDGLQDGEEVYLRHTDPFKPDSDGDGWGDSFDPAPMNNLLPKAAVVALVAVILVSIVIRFKKTLLSCVRTENLTEKECMHATTL